LGGRRLIVRLLGISRDPRALVVAISACKSHFLGSYFESLFFFRYSEIIRFSDLFGAFQNRERGAKRLAK